MVRTKSTMLPLGTPAPKFSLEDVVSGKTISLDTFKDKKGLLVMVICQHCSNSKFQLTDVHFASTRNEVTGLQPFRPASRV